MPSVMMDFASVHARTLAALGLCTREEADVIALSVGA